MREQGRKDPGLLNPKTAPPDGQIPPTEALRAEIAGVLTAISAAETRLTWRMLAVGGLVIAALRLLG